MRKKGSSEINIKTIVTISRAELRYCHQKGTELALTSVGTWIVHAKPLITDRIEAYDSLDDAPQMELQSTRPGLSSLIFPDFAKNVNYSEKFAWRLLKSLLKVVAIVFNLNVPLR